MCDTVVGRAQDGSLWLAKNSDREPSEAQVVEHLPRARRAPRLACTHIEIDDVAETFEVVLSRPVWMWGAEMGVNERGVAIGNEAVFTRLPLDPVGLTGMDLLRLALERAPTARAAVDIIVALIRRHGQGGRMGFAKRKMSYASSFLIVDPAEAWVLETAGRVWAASEVARQPGQVRAISNGLTLGASPELLDEDAVAVAKAHGWCRGRDDFDFSRCFGDRTITRLAGAAARSACTTAHVARAGGDLDLEVMAGALRDHRGAAPSHGLIMNAPCAHAGPWPTRTSGQSTGSLAAHLGGDGPRVWATGTSSPCLSVFKRVPLATGSILDAGPPPGETSDHDSLWWRHERLHRAVLQNWRARAPEVIAQARALEDAACDAPDVWQRHREMVPRWRDASWSRRRTLPLPARWYWRRMNRRDGLAG